MEKVVFIKMVSYYLKENGQFRKIDFKFKIIGKEKQK